MSRDILPEPPNELKQMSKTLCGRIREAMEPGGTMPFSRFMEMALYEPGLGYYSAGLHKLGESGDFVTAPELGTLFAECLARQAMELADVLGEYDILEIGAGTGRLAADLLRALEPEQLPRRYLVLERSADLRRVQRDTLDAAAPKLLERVQWLDRPPAQPWQGLLLANEVLDALAVERFRIGDSGVEQLCVSAGEKGFRWSSRPAPAPLEQAVEQAIASEELRLPTGYRSEINPQMASWLGAVSSTLARGLALFIDYGYPRREFYRPERTDGTLMCHYRHRAHDDVFFWPGLQDITSWVDFTALAEAADAQDMDVEGYSSLSLFLVGCGLDEAIREHTRRNPDSLASISAQARQLTLPGMMGEKFQVMGLGRGLDAPLRGFSLQDLRYRL